MQLDPESEGAGPDAHPARRRRVASVELLRFRNLADATIEIGPGLTLLSGRNGQGKTNLLEALYLLGTSKSFRTGQAREMIRLGKEDAVVAGQMRPGERLAVRLSTRTPAKELFRGGTAVSLGSYLGAFHPIAFTAEARMLVAGGPEQRRAFVDRGVAAGRSSYLGEIAAYRRALRQKARLLEGRAGTTEVEAWNAEVARRGAVIAAERRGWTEALKKNSRRSPGVSSGRRRRSISAGSLRRRRTGGAPHARPRCTRVCSAPRSSGRSRPRSGPGAS